jgi:hypothetical protein
VSYARIFDSDGFVIETITFLQFLELLSDEFIAVVVTYFGRS